MTNHYRRLLAYNRWANAQTLDSLRGKSPPPGAVRWMAHIVGAEYHIDFTPAARQGYVV